MKKMLLTLALCGVTLLGLVACGDDVTEVYESKGKAYNVLESGEKLSKRACDSVNAGEILFVKDSLKTFVCDGDEWTVLGRESNDDEPRVDTVYSKDTVYVRDTTKSLSDVGCSAKKVKKNDRNGVEITCGKNVIDTLWNGEDGEPGEDGIDGENGASCHVVYKENGLDESFSITCGDGDDAKSTDVLRLCEGLPYNPESELCDSRDGSIYKLVEIAGAKVMGENLNYKTDDSYCGGGETYDYNWSKVRSSWTEVEYDDDIWEGDCSEYGRLYSYELFEKAKSFKTLCPAGSHLPTWSEVVKLAALDKNILHYLNESDDWLDDERYTDKRDDKYGLGILPAGYYYKAEVSYEEEVLCENEDGCEYEGLFYDYDDYYTVEKTGEKIGFYTTNTGAGFWVADGSKLIAYYWRYYYGTDYVLKIEDVKNYGFSVRCVLD